MMCISKNFVNSWDFPFPLDPKPASRFVSRYKIIQIQILLESFEISTVHIITWQHFKDIKDPIVGWRAAPKIHSHPNPQKL